MDVLGKNVDFFLQLTIMFVNVLDEYMHAFFCPMYVIHRRLLLPLGQDWLSHY